MMRPTRFSFLLALVAAAVLVGTALQAPLNASGLSGGGSGLSGIPYDLEADSLTLDAGSAAAPTLVWDDDADTGLFKPSGTTLGYAANGVESLRFTSNGIILQSGRRIELDEGGSAAAPALVTNGDTDTGFYGNGSDSMSYAAAGTERFRMNTTSVHAFVPAFRVNDAAPAIQLLESDASADEQLWRWIMSGGTLTLQAVEDDFGSSDDAISYSRSAAAVTSVEVRASAFRVDVNNAGSNELLVNSSAVQASVALEAEAGATVTGTTTTDDLTVTDDAEVTDLLEVGRLEVGAAGTRDISNLGGNYATHNASSISAGASETWTLSVTGADTTQWCQAMVAGDLDDGLILDCYISSAGTATFTLHNTTAGAINPASLTYAAIVWDLL